MANCAFQKEPQAGQRIEKYRKLSKQNEVRDDSRVTQIPSVDQLGIGQKEKAVPGLAPEPSRPESGAEEQVNRADAELKLSPCPEGSRTVVKK